MTTDRITELLAEIGMIARNPRVVLLANELGDEIRREFGLTNERVQKIAEKTTYAVIDVSETLTDDMRALRRAMLLLEEKVNSNQEIVSGRVHTMANHFGSIEARLGELAEAVSSVIEQLNAQKPPLLSPYDASDVIQIDDDGSDRT